MSGYLFVTFDSTSSKKFYGMETLDIDEAWQGWTKLLFMNGSYKQTNNLLKWICNQINLEFVLPHREPHCSG